MSRADSKLNFPRSELAECFPVLLEIRDRDVVDFVLLSKGRPPAYAFRYRVACEAEPPSAPGTGMLRLLGFPAPHEARSFHPDSGPFAMSSGSFNLVCMGDVFPPLSQLTALTVLRPKAWAAVTDASACVPPLQGTIRRSSGRLGGGVPVVVAFGVPGDGKRLPPALTMLTRDTVPSCEPPFSGQQERHPNDVNDGNKGGYWDPTGATPSVFPAPYDTEFYSSGRS